MPLLDFGTHVIGSYQGDRLSQLAIEATGTVVHDAETPDKYSRFVVIPGAKMAKRVVVRGIDIKTTSTTLGGGNFVI